MSFPLNCIANFDSACPEVSKYLIGSAIVIVQHRRPCPKGHAYPNFDKIVKLLPEMPKMSKY